LEDEIYKSKAVKPRNAWNEKIQMVFSDWPPADKLFIKLWKKQTLRHDVPLGEAEMNLSNLLQESGYTDVDLDIYRLNRLKSGKIHLQITVTPIQINQTNLPPQQVQNSKSLSTKKGDRSSAMISALANAFKRDPQPPPLSRTSTDLSEFIHKK